MSQKAPTTLGGFVLPVKSVSPSSLYGDDEFQYLDIASVDRDARSILSPQTIKTTNAPSRARQLVQANDIIVSTVRPNLNTVAHVPAEYDGAIASTGFCVLRANPKVLDHRYLYHWISSQKSVDYLVSVATGASYPAVSEKIIKGMDFDPPSLEEQKRIAAILDKADSLRRKRAQAIALADDFLRATFLDMFGDPVTNPKGWPVVKFDALGKWSSGGTPSRQNESYFQGGINWFSAGELNSMFVIESIEKISELALKESSAKLWPAGSILLGMYDTAAFKSSIVLEPSAANQACACLQVNNSVFVEWFYFYVQISKNNYLSLRRGVRQKNLNLGMIRDFELPLPSLEMQEKFLSVFNGMKSVVSKNDEALQAAASMQAALTGRLM